MSKPLISYLVIIGLILSCETPSKPKSDSSSMLWKITKTEDWFKDDGLSNPESVIYDPLHDVLYISNGTNYAPGNTGFISRASSDGQSMQLKWVSGLNRPTGMALQDSILFAADVNVLVAIDTRDGAILQKYPEPVSGSGLNDVVVNESGDIFVSASATSSILRLINGQLTNWVSDGEQLKYVNGLLIEKREIFAGGLHLSAIDLYAKHIRKIPNAPTIRDIEGMVSDGNGGYFLTTVDQSALYFLASDQKSYSMLEGNSYFGDLSFNSRQRTLYIPRGNFESGEFFITVVQLHHLIK